MNRNILGALIASALLTQSVGAQTPEGTVTAEKKVTNPFHIKYWGGFYGPNFEDGSTLGKTRKSVELDKRVGEVSDLTPSYISISNQFTFAYDLTDTMSVFASPRFSFNPVLTGGFKLLNARVGFTHKKLVTLGDFNLGITLRAELPTSAGALAAGTIINPQIVLAPSYKFGSTGLKLSANTLLRSEIASGRLPFSNTKGLVTLQNGNPGTGKGGMDFGFIVMPELTYKVNDTFSPMVGFELANSYGQKVGYANKALNGIADAKVLASKKTSATDKTAYHKAASIQTTTDGKSTPLKYAAEPAWSGFEAVAKAGVNITLTKSFSVVPYVYANIRDLKPENVAVAAELTGTFF